MGFPWGSRGLCPHLVSRLPLVEVQPPPPFLQSKTRLLSVPDVAFPVCKSAQRHSQKRGSGLTGDPPARQDSVRRQPERAPCPALANSARGLLGFSGREVIRLSAVLTSVLITQERKDFQCVYCVGRLAPFFKLTIGLLVDFLELFVYSGVGLLLF